MENLKYLDKNHKHPIETTIATKEDRAYWQKHVMPFEKSETAKKWNWKSNLGEIGKAYSLGKVLGQNPELVVLKKNNIPIGMLLQVKNYSEKITTGKIRDTAMIWYVQKAPKEYLIKHGINEKEFDIKIAKAIIDVSLTSSLKESGNVLLHADPKGGNRLLEFYRQEGFTQMPKEKGRISSGRANDGRYFYMNKHKVLSIVKHNRELIGQSIEIPCKNNSISNKELYEKVKAFKESRPEATKDIHKSKGLEL